MKCEKCKFKNECHGAEYHNQDEIEYCPVFRPETIKPGNLTDTGAEPIQGTHKL
jgi:hypothetical protein